MEINSNAEKVTIDSAAPSKSAERLAARQNFKPDDGNSRVQKISSSEIDNTAAIISQLGDITLDVSVDNATNEAIISLRSKITGEVLFTIPAEESRNIQRTIQAVKGSIINKSV